MTTYKLDTSDMPAQRTFMESRDSELLYSGAFGAGKSKIGCEKGLFLSLKYPNNVGAIIRKNFAHLRISTLVTWRRDVCPEAFEAKFDKNTSTVTLTNGSIIYFLGLDQAQKIGSLELGWAFVDEAIELTEDDWIMLLGRLRLPSVEFRQLFAATNPGPPNHFLYNRFFTRREGLVVESNTLDNKFLPEDYRKRMEKLTGRYYERYVLGKWIGFEGLVYDNFDPARHYIPPFDIPEDWEHYRTIDFGYTNPFVCQWWARPPKESGEGANKKRPFYMYKEIYKSQVTAEDHGKKIKQETESPIRRTFADWDAGDRATLENAGIPTQKAQKAISPGIQEVYERIDADEIYIFQNATIGRDEILAEKKKPTSTIEEFALYHWQNLQNLRADRNEKEEPVDRDNHGMDAMKYLFYTLKVLYSPIGNKIITEKKVNPLVSVGVRNWSGYGMGRRTYTNI